MDCLYCSSSFIPRVGGKPQIFCGRFCRQNYLYHKNKGPSTRKHWKELFWAKVNKTESCWLWTGLTVKGYGQFGHRNSWSLSFKDVKEVAVHRISWVLEYGDIPDGLGVLHKCDTPPCIRPIHLFLGDNLINNRDKIYKGRAVYAVGEGCKRSSLINTDIIRIRELWDSGIWSQQELASLYGITQSSIGDIVRGVTWKHLL